MTFWEPLWKWVFLVGAALFAAVSIWVALAGVGDIRRLFAALDRKSPPPLRGRGGRGSRSR